LDLLPHSAVSRPEKGQDHGSQWPGIVGVFGLTAHESPSSSSDDKIASIRDKHHGLKTMKLQDIVGALGAVSVVLRA
jgi:hypothetical protein